MAVGTDVIWKRHADQLLRDDTSDDATIDKHSAEGGKSDLQSGEGGKCDFGDFLIRSDHTVEMNEPHMGLPDGLPDALPNGNEVPDDTLNDNDMCVVPARKTYPTRARKAPDRFGYYY